ncbi:BA75_02495T0 [Komagataella pastoris]|uniref:BA75_02495T0 n=1 Tax=Komagataella pastoris TaxID=4922 RepID=A0A1B2JDG4_PICPA|nr:BA75_02495T0 [Komagataella pastoris]
MSGIKREREQDDSGQDEHAPVQETFKRARVVSDESRIVKSLCIQLSKIGENPDAYANDSIYSAVPFASDIGSDTFRDAILRFAKAFVLEQPHKLFHFSGVVLLANSKNEKVGLFLIEYIHQQIQELLNENNKDSSSVGNFTKIKAYLRFLASLLPMINTDSVYNIFSQFLKLSLSLKDSNLSQFLFFIVTSSIPFIVASNQGSEAYKEIANKLIEEAGVYSDETISPNESLLVFQSLNGSNTDLPYKPKLLVKLILPAVKALQSANWENLPFIDTYSKVLPEIEKSESPIVKHSIPQFNVPEFSEDPMVGSVEQLWKHPRTLFEAHPESLTKNNNKYQTKPPVESYLALVLRDQVQDLVVSMDYNRFVVSAQLLLFSKFYRDKLFCKTLSSPQKLSILCDLLNDPDCATSLNSEGDSNVALLIDEVQQNIKDGYVSTWKIEDVITESVLDLMLHLPKLEFPPAVYYGTLLVECCNKDLKQISRTPGNQTSAITKSVGALIEYLYKQNKFLDYSLRLLYLDWITIQFSNFEFEWRWEDWANDEERLRASKFHPNAILIRNLIGKEVRMASVATIRKTLPEEFHRYLDLSIYSKDRMAQDTKDIFGDLSSLFTKDVETYENGSIKVKDEDIELTDSFLFINEEHPFMNDCIDVYDNLHQSDVSVEQFSQIIADLKTKLQQHSEFSINSDKYIIMLLIQATCVTGGRSLSIFNRALGVSKDKIRAVFDTLIDDKSLLNSWIIDSVLILWNHEPRIGYLLIEKLCHEKFIPASSIVDSVFSYESSLPMISQFYTIELVNRLFEGHGEDKEFLFSIFRNFTTSMNSLIKSLGITDVISAPAEDEESGEVNELKWGYVQLCSLLKSLLRDHFASFSPLRGQLEEELTIEHEPTKKFILSIFGEA